MVVQADGREPEELLANPEVAGHLDLTQPVGLLMVALLHFVPDDQDPSGIVGRYATLLPAGSWFVMSHGSTEGFDGDRMEELYRRTPTPVTVRTKAQLADLLGDVELVEPGIVFITGWRPDDGDDRDDDPSWVSTYGAVGRLG